MQQVTRIWSLLFLISMLSQSLIAEEPKTNPYAPWHVIKIDDPDDLISPSGFKLCQRVNVLPYESCTVWKMIHKNDPGGDKNPQRPFYFARVDDRFNPVAEGCITEEFIRNKMIQVTNQALSISKTDENGILFDKGAGLIKADCQVYATCTNSITCERGSIFSVQANYSGDLPSGFGCQGVKNAVEPSLKGCESSSDSTVLTIILGAIGGTIGLGLIVAVSLCICKYFAPKYYLL